MNDGESDDSEVVTEFLDPLTVRARARVGQTLKGKWRLDLLLGVGGMAAVYGATHRNGSRVAIKLLHQDLSINAHVRTRFLREGYIANQVEHAGAVRVSDDDVAEDGAAFLVMELLDGETLEDRRVRSGGQLSEDEVLSATDQLLDVLAAAQAKGIVHRDLKPENVFLTRLGVVKVLDFGIARLREVSTASTATRSGSSMGTPSYMPPEQARGRWDEVDARSDLWAVGATMFHLLTGKLVHDGHTANEVLLEAMTRPAPPVAEVVPTVTPAVARLVDKALAFEREKRWLDAGRMQEALRRAYHDRHGKPITTAPKMTVPESVPNRTLGPTPSVAAAKQPTTARPVASSQAGAKAPPRRLLVAVTAGAVVLVAGIWALSAGHHGEPAAASPSPALASAATTGAPAATPTVERAPINNPPPTIAATDLPTAAAPPAQPEPAPATATTRAIVPAPHAAVPANPPAAPKTTAAPPPPVSAEPVPAPAPAKPNCNPPYTIDPVTGKKHFKVECL